jgi:LssY C-terminus
MKLLARERRWLLILGAVPVVYVLLAYLILPLVWTHHEHEPGLASLPMVTRTGDGIPGDALNVGLVGNKEDVTRAMHAAEWFPADPITLRTSIEIIGSVMLDRPYHDAPVSPLYYKGKKGAIGLRKT